jgi:teichuronic acid exporter
MTANFKGRFATGVMWLVAAKTLAQAATWMISLVVVRLLSPQDYGLMGMAFLFSGFLQLFSEIGLGSSLIRIRTLDPGELSTVAWSLVLLNVALFVLLIAAAPYAAEYFREPALTNVVRVLSFVFLLNGIGMTSGFLLARDMEFAKRARAEFAGSLSGAFVTLAMAMTGFGVWSLVVGHLAQSLVNNALTFMFCPVPLGLTFSASALKRHLNFGFQVAAARLLWFVSANADFMIVGRVLGTVQLGYYALAFQLASIPIDKGVSIVTHAALPLFSASQDDNATLRRQFSRLVGILALITAPVFVGMASVSDLAIRLFLEPRWHPVVLPLQMLCVMSVWRAAVMLNAPLLTAIGRPAVVTRNSLLQVLTMPLAFYLATAHGLLGIALVWMIVWPVSAIWLTRQTLVAIDLRLRDYLAAVMHPVAGSALMALVIAIVTRGLLSRTPSTSGLIFACATGALTYVGYHIAFNRTAMNDAIALVRRARRSRPAPKAPGAVVAADAGAPAARIVSDVRSA